MSLYLVDTDAIVDYLKGISISFLQNLLNQGQTLATSDVVTGEVYSGLRPEHRATGERLMDSLVYLSTSRAAARQAGDWRYAYARRGVSLSLTETLIAATALEHGAVVVTANVRDYPMSELTTLPLPRVAAP